MKRARALNTICIEIGDVGFEYFWKDEVGGAGVRITCPCCGERDRREFYYRGAAVDLERPAPDAGEAAWDDFVYLRDNPAGVTRELWYHEGGCGAWIVVTRNTVTHEILGTQLASEVNA